MANKMINSRGTAKRVNATRTGNPGAKTATGELSMGEGIPVAAVQETILVERPNMSINRNAGPTGPSANPGTIPIVTQAVRKTGRI